MEPEGSLPHSQASHNEALTVDFRNFANAPKNMSPNSAYGGLYYITCLAQSMANGTRTRLTSATLYHSNKPKKYSTPAVNAY